MYTNDAELVYTFMWAAVWAGFLILFLSAFSSRYLVRVATFPVYYLAPVVMLLSIVGSFAIRNNVLDVGIMIAIGITGYILDKFGFKAGPIALGLILGPIIEAALVTSLAFVGGSRNVFEVFVWRPVSLVLIGLIILSAFWPWMSKRMFARTGWDEEAMEDEV